MQVQFNGELQRGVTSKDIVLHLIKLIGTAGGTGHAIEFSGSYISSASMESRMTICNMAIEAGAKVGLIGVDSITLDYVKKHSNLTNAMFNKANEYWLSLRSDDGANFDKKITIDVSQIKPQVTWGTSPEMTIDFDADIPFASDIFS
jgi:3-isopropylmalate/(R)-2-methylmalate dehydratase large subunit